MKIQLLLRIHIHLQYTVHNAIVPKALQTGMAKSLLQFTSNYSIRIQTHGDMLQSYNVLQSPTLSDHKVLMLAFAHENLRKDSSMLQETLKRSEQLIIPEIFGKADCIPC